MDKINPITRNYGRLLTANLGATQTQPPLDPDTDKRLAALAGVTLSGRALEKADSTIPAGYTYLGQFIAHDLSFEQIQSGKTRIEPRDIANLRTPQLDLDSLYGGGPRVAPYLYRLDQARNVFAMAPDQKA